MQAFEAVTSQQATLLGGSFMRTPKPWKRSQNGSWYIELDGKQINLGKDKQVAMERYHQLMSARRLGKDVAHVTVRQVLDAYWGWYKKTHAESTVNHRTPVLQSFAKSVSAKLRARDLRGHHVQSWLDKEFPDNGPSTLGTYIATIKAAMNWAVAQGYLESNPIAKMPKPRPKMRQEFVPADLWPKVLELATDQEFRDFLTVMLSAGCRPQEIVRFEARHFDGTRIVLELENSKGQKRNRVVYLPDDALGIVQRLAKEFPEGKLFKNRKGKPWDKNSITSRFRRLKTLLGMPKLCATTLRHSFAHHRLTSGQDALTVATLMGHADTKMISQRYGHLSANSSYLKAAANQVKIPQAPVGPGSDSRQ